MSTELQMRISDRQGVKAKKLAGTKLRKAGIRDIREFDVKGASWGELCQAQKNAVTVARDLLERITEDTDEDEARELEDAHEAMMAFHEVLDWEKDKRNGKRTGPPGYSKPSESADASPVLSREQRMTNYVQARGYDPEYGELGLGRYLRSMVLGASNDLERRALAGGSDSAGGYTTPEILSSQLIDLLRANNRAIQAGAVTIPVESDTWHIAKVATDPEPAWRAENAAVAESEPTFSRITFTPHTLAVVVRASRELLEDSLNINQALPQMLAAAMAQEMDRVIFNGSGSGDEPEGLDNISGVLSHAHDAAIDSYSPLVRARRLVLDENAEPGAWVMAPKVEEAFGDLTDSNGQPLQHPPILDRPQPLSFLTTSKLPTDLGTGDNEGVIYGGQWDQIAIGMRNNVQIQVLRERYADNYQFGFLCTMRMDVQALRPNALVRITGVQV